MVRDTVVSARTRGRLVDLQAVRACLEKASVHDLHHVVPRVAALVGDAHLRALHIPAVGDDHRVVRAEAVAAHINLIPTCAGAAVVHNHHAAGRSCDADINVAVGQIAEAAQRKTRGVRESDWLLRKQRASP